MIRIILWVDVNFFFSQLLTRRQILCLIWIKFEREKEYTTTMTPMVMPGIKYDQLWYGGLYFSGVFFVELLWFVGQREEKLRCEFQRTQSDNGGIEGNGRGGRWSKENGRKGSISSEMASDKLRIRFIWLNLCPSRSRSFCGCVSNPLDSNLSNTDTFHKNPNQEYSTFSRFIEQ